jgi:uncharacterized metal-binding protein YceD (DUF177 family)
MRYKTNDIGEHGLAVDVPLSPAWLAENCPDLGGELGAAGVRFVGRLESTGDDFLLRGKLSGALNFTCVRCLEPTTLQVDADMAVIFVEGPDESHLPKGKDVVNLDEGDDGDFALFQDGVIDIGPELREELFLAVPYSPACEPECLGICLVCGENRAKTPCDCEEREKLKRSPFADLANLKPVKAS